VVYSLFSYHQKNLGGPGSSRGTLERTRAGLTVPPPPPPPRFQGEGTHAWGRGGGGVPISTRGHTLWCSRYIYVLADRKYHVCNDYSIRRLGWNCTVHVNQQLTDNESVAWAGNTRVHRMPRAYTEKSRHPGCCSCNLYILTKGRERNHPPCSCQL
jgi:hypothetical protein